MNSTLSFFLPPPFLFALTFFTLVAYKPTLSNPGGPTVASPPMKCRLKGRGGYAFQASETFHQEMGHCFN